MPLRTCLALVPAVARALAHGVECTTITRSRHHSVLAELAWVHRSRVEGDRVAIDRVNALAREILSLHHAAQTGRKVGSTRLHVAAKVARDLKARGRWQIAADEALAFRCEFPLRNVAGSSTQLTSRLDSGRFSGSTGKSAESDGREELHG
jgi:hypothetical protein